MKKTFFLTLTLFIYLILFEAASFSILKLYPKIFAKNFNTKTEKKYEYIYADDIQQKKKYSAFYGWRRSLHSNHNKFNVRKSLTNKNWNKKNYIYFFGGSTILGNGTTFDGSIPSHFSNLNHSLQPVNIGEDSYVSGQSLNRLIEIINEINRNDIVVFYDGVNDVLINCRKNIGLNGHSRVLMINQLIKDQDKIFKTIYNKFLRTFQKTYSFALINKALKKLFSYDLKYQSAKQNYICGEKNNAIEVAKNLKRHWMVAETLVQSRGAKFFAFLQPSRYTADFKVNYPSRKIRKKSYDDVYPLIREMIKNKENYHDLSKSLKKNYYVDWCCHLHSEGNQFISRKIYNFIF